MPIINYSFKKNIKNHELTMDINLELNEKWIWINSIKYFKKNNWKRKIAKRILIDKSTNS